MAGYFFDTSALVKASHSETGTQRELSLLAESGALFSISSLASVELESALAQNLRSGIITLPQYLMARGKFGGDVRTKLFFVQNLFRRHQRSAEALIVKDAPTKRLRTLDALQLAVALELILSGAADHFVVADQHLAQVAALEGLSVVNPDTP
jgi:uncharacterized protein